MPLRALLALPVTAIFSKTVSFAIHSNLHFAFTAFRSHLTCSLVLKYRANGTTEASGQLNMFGFFKKIKEARAVQKELTAIFKARGHLRLVTKLKSPNGSSMFVHHRTSMRILCLYCIGNFSKVAHYAFAAACVAPKALEGRRIRVRGWIEQRGGPIIAAEAPEQIEFAD